MKYEKMRVKRCAVVAKTSQLVWFFPTVGVVIVITQSAVGKKWLVVEVVVTT